MLNALLSLVLATTQLLAWSGGSLYLCLSDNGFHCVDFGPASCTCCHSPAEQDEHADHCCSDAAVTCDGDHAGYPKPENIASPIFASDSCGCTHVQITSQQPTSILQASSAMDVERHLQFAAVLPFVLSGDLPLGDRFDPACSRGSPPIPSQALIILASIILRC